METAKVILEVMGGVLLGTAEPEHTRRWAISGREWEEAEDVSALLAERVGQAQGYAALLMLQPDRFNWVRLDWVWL